MSEPVFYKDKWFLLSSGLVSWLQKFLEIFLSQYDHPQWFKEMLNDLHWNFHMPHGKFFFDSEKIGGDREKIRYITKMLDHAIRKMESMTFLEFRDFIGEAVKGSWCDFSNTDPIELTDELKRSYNEKYIGTLKKMKDLIQEDLRDHL